MEIMEIYGECVSYVNKVEEISSTDRGYVRSELVWLAEWIRERYPFMNCSDLRKFITDMIAVSV